MSTSWRVVRVSGSFGQVPHLARGVGVLAQDGQALADVGDVGVGVRLVGVAEHGGGLAGQGGGEEPVAQVGLGAAAGPEVVRRAADGDLTRPASCAASRSRAIRPRSCPFVVCAS